MKRFVLPFIFLALVNIRAIVCEKNQGALDHLQILVRHGERNPLLTVPELGQFEIGALTPKGYRLAKEFGSKLRRRYPNFFAASPAVRSIPANKSRCIETAEAIIEGLNIEKQSRELLPTIDIMDFNVTVLSPLLKEFNKVQFPACAQKAATKVIRSETQKYPPAVFAFVESLFRGQLAETIDSLVQSEYTGDAFGINIGTCIQPRTKLLGEEAFVRLTEICMQSQCTGSVSKVKDELHEFSDQNSPPRSIERSASVYALADVQLADLLQTFLPQFNHTQPSYGEYILLETRGDDVTMLTGEDASSEPEERAILNVYEVIQLLRRRILSA